VIEPPANPKIYHIVHADRLASITAAGHLCCDARMVNHSNSGTTIGMSDIKVRRLRELTLSSHSGLYVGQCVPFYFCPRSVMLYLIHQANHPGLSYRGGQKDIVHLEANLHSAVAWAESRGLRWAFTLSNAGARYFDDCSDLAELGKVNWEAVQATKWSGLGVSPEIKEGKQAEFLVEDRFPWSLVERIGVFSSYVGNQVSARLGSAGHRPRVEVLRSWYY
jgi:hypothetical protein